MNESQPSENSARTLAIRSQETLDHKRLGFHTALGTEWFEYSPEKVKDYFYEMGAIMARHRCLDDIAFSSVLGMSSLNINNLEDQPVFGSNFCEVLETKVKDDARAAMLSRVCGSVLKLPEFKLLRDQVNRLVEADLVAADVSYDPKMNILLKVRLNTISPTFSTLH